MIERSNAAGHRVALPARAVAAALVASAFFIPILIALLTTVPGAVRTSLADGGETGNGVPVELRGRTDLDIDGPFFIQQTRLRTKDPGRLVARQQIRLLVISFQSEPDLRAGELRFAGTPCAYRTTAGTRFPDEGLLTFHRGPGCAQMQGVGTGELVLELRFTRPARAALWTYLRPESSVPAEALAVSRFGLDPSIGVPIARGELVDVYPETSASRLTLLAYLWNLSPSPRWIVLAVAGCALLVGGAVFTGWRGPRAATERGTWYRSAAAFMGALALSGTYAVIVPPFQAADEPSHLLALIAYLGRPELADQTATWARGTQFQEIRFHPERRFSPMDRGRPGEAWTAVVVPNDIRGAGVQGLWAMAAPALRTAGAPQLLINMRVLYALIFASSVALFTFLVARFTDAPTPELLAVPLFLVPTLPYFGMNMSNYAPLLGVYVILAAGVVIASWDGARAHVAGPIFGVTFAAAIAFSRSAVPLVPLVTSLLLARVALGDRQGRHGPAWVYWVGFTSMLIGGLALADRTYVSGLESFGGRIAASTDWLALILRRPWLLVAPGAAALGAELMLAALRRRWAAGRGETVHTAVRWVALGAAAALLLLFSASLWVPFPTLYSVDPLHLPPARDYVQRAVMACATVLRFGRPDHLTSITFWGGFGWLDTLAPNLLVSLLAASSGVALVLLFVWVGRTGSGRVLVWLGFAANGFVLSAALYALSIARATWADLHGRYLLGLYISLLVIAWSALARMDRSGWIRRRDLLLGVAGLACLAVHAYCISFILARYF